MSYVVLDIETHDPWIGLGRGSGWPEKQAEFLCATTHTEDGTKRTWLHHQTESLLDYLSKFKQIVAHNAMYEMGVLYSYGLDITKHTWTCTRLMAIIHHNDRMSFSLDSLSDIYLGKHKNSNETLGKLALELGLISSAVRHTGKAVLSKYMKDVYEARPDVVLEYNEQDVALTHDLFKTLLLCSSSNYDYEFYSDLQKALTLSRSRGLRVSMASLKSLNNKLLFMLEPLYDMFEGMGINPNSPKQLIDYFQGEGVQLPLNKNDSPSTSVEALEKLDHPVAVSLLEYRGLNKLRTSYVAPLLEVAPRVGDFFTVYPEITIFGASKTGRCSARNPNIQNVPTRKALGRVVRGLYYPIDGYKFASLDYSGQELRLLIHYASLTKQPVDDLVQSFINDPEYDIYQEAADSLNIKRPAAKTIILGIAYGMWYTTLAKQLKVSESEAQKQLEKIKNKYPFLDVLYQTAKKLIETRGYVKDISGRRIHMPAMMSKKGINAVIQGSAAYQTNKAIVDCYRQGLLIAAPIHDELLVMYKDDTEVDDIKRIMQEAVPLAVPVVVHCSTGNNWGEIK